jgi:hypothetical protein
MFKNKDEEKLEKIAKQISKYASFTVLGFILISIFWPWVRLLLF